MNLLREIRLAIAVLVLFIWAHTDEYRHQCLDDRPEYCTEQDDE